MSVVVVVCVVCVCVSGVGRVVREGRSGGCDVGLRPRRHLRDQPLPTAGVFLLFTRGHE